ncbi:MAG: cation:proton antiporter [Polaromonas sp.]|jgi:Kef-type K+ transport system membrane component KefB|uniref:cation:proton antiporter domain-containing protein n=1 Tax=Polaromonas sp. TaxID=1869339 RepID=UPI0027320CB6|nr:cation:proton antiporter [Polaromonas sp.]MDP2257972.1 cation:proton antiporter [Polaromonas sp.]MDP3707330.1 cation:proton antiporter [Polaromonas sp.]
MNEILAIWAEWIKPSAGLPTVQWSILLALAAAAGHLVNRYSGLPKVIGYSVVGAFAGLAGFTGAIWPLQGIGLFLLELGVAVVLFEAGGRIPLRWFRHNPMVLVQSLVESTLTFILVYWALGLMGVQGLVAESLALLAMAASPAVLSRVAIDTRAAGPVTERAMVLSTLSSLYALTLCSARAGMMPQGEAGLASTLFPVLVVLGMSVVVAAVLALTLRTALRVMSPTSENTAILLLALIAAGAALAANFGGSAALAALLGGMLLKQLNPRPWSWPRQMGTASSMLTMLMFVLVSVVAAQADWSAPVAGVVAVLVLARMLAKIAGVAIGNVGSGSSWKQALWVGCAMSPMSSVALLLVSQYVAASGPIGRQIAGVALPAILLMEVLGAILATVAIYRAGESSKPWAPLTRGPATGPVHES